MYFQIPFILFILTASYPEAAHAKLQTRIINGNDAEPSEFPWLVSIQHDNSHICGGSLISNQFVLTAAHCLFTYENVPIESRHLHVLLGTHSLKNMDNVVQIGIKRCIIHPHYRSNNTEKHFDIALLELSHRVKSKTIWFPDLPSKDLHFTSNSVLRAAGWGLMEGEQIPSQLQVVDLPYLKYPECQNRYGKVFLVTSHVICTDSSFADICQGDSGGPLILETEHSHGRIIQTLVGVTSLSSPGCNRHNSASFFTRVSKFMESFILPNLVHRHYHKNKHLDIALLELVHRVESKTIWFPCLPSKDLHFTNNTVFRAAAWGEAKEERNPSKLQVVDLIYLDHHECQKRYGKVFNLTSHLICTDSSSADICQGDSGGPLVLETKNSHGRIIQTLVGVTSLSSAGCNKHNSGSLFTRVSKFMDSFIMPKLSHTSVKCNGLKNRAENLAPILTTLLFSLFGALNLH